MNDFCLWSVTGMAALISLTTLWRLWADRERLAREELTDEDRSFAWRIVIFLIFPFLTFLDLRATIVACDLYGGSVAHWVYGLMWYHLEPSGLTSNQSLIGVYFAGAILQLALAVCMLPSLLFRPHPFLATLVGYTIAFIFGLNLIADPLLSVINMGSPRWQIVYDALPADKRVAFMAVHAAAASIYLALMFSQRVRMLFARLSRPVASDELRGALRDFRSHPDSGRLACRVGLLYDKAGLRRRARAQLKRLKKSCPSSLYATFLEAVLSYRRRDYRVARQAFILASDYPGVAGELKASLLAAAACAAFAGEDIIGALNLSERALEFDDYCLIARMVKVDVFLRQGKKEEAGEEILLAMREGLTLDLEKKVPLDSEAAFESIAQLEDRLGDRIRAPQRDLQRQSRD